MTPGGVKLWEPPRQGRGFPKGLISQDVDAARGTCRAQAARYDARVSRLDFLVAETLADRIFAGARGGDDEDDDEAHSMPASRCALNKRCAGRDFVEGDELPEVTSLQRLAQTAWIHYCHARVAAAGAEGDPLFSSLAQRAVRRAHQAVLAIRRAAVRAV